MTSAAKQALSAEELARYTAPGQYVDSGHPAVVAFAQRVAGGATAPREIATRLYHAVRDEFLYDPYRCDTGVEGLKASRVIEVAHGFCVTKAALLAAAGRVFAIPARLGYADVRNHLTSKRLYEQMGTDLFVFHGYTDLWIDGRWVKATPAFNRTLCEKAGVHPLEFDGSADSVFHEFDTAGRRHMEYVRNRGTYADVPRHELLVAWGEHYKSFSTWGEAVDRSADFQQEAGRAS